MKNENVLIKVGVVMTFLLSILFSMYAVKHDEEQALLAKQIAYEKWSQNNLFMNTLERYNEIYYRLDQHHDKEAGKKITGNKPYVLKEIYISFDNGIHDTQKYVIDGRKGGIRQPPPFWSLQTGQLLEYVKTGNAAQLLPLGRSENPA
jgi:hypothetical protein